MTWKIRGPKLEPWGTPLFYILSTGCWWWCDVFSFPCNQCKIEKYPAIPSFVVLVGQAESNNWLIMEDDPAAGAADSLKFSPFNGSSYFLYLLSKICGVTFRARSELHPHHLLCRGSICELCSSSFWPFSLRVWMKSDPVERKRSPENLRESAVCQETTRSSFLWNKPRRAESGLSDVWLRTHL